MGCTACYNKCLDIKQVITMKQDSKGFYYPVVDASKCVGCHSCEKACPYHKKIEKNLYNILDRFKSIKPKGIDTNDRRNSYWRSIFLYR
jgi:predicted aldo/keto reductase-like oxidoreductase